MFGIGLVAYISGTGSCLLDVPMRHNRGSIAMSMLELLYVHDLDLAEFAHVFAF